VLPVTKLAKEDQDYITKAAEEKKAETEAAAKAEKFKTSPMIKALDGTTVKMDGKSVKKYDILTDKAPEYYLLYWGASW
jgi:D-aminopeptidase